MNKPTPELQQKILIKKLNRLNPRSVQTTIETLGTINFYSAYGHVPKICKATNEILDLLYRLNREKQ